MTEYVLEARGVAAGYGHIEALHGVDLTVRAGEAVTLVGANGAGKTTLLKTLVGLVAATRGSIRLRGHDVTRWPVQKRARAGLALVPEGRHVFSGLSVQDNLLIGGHGRGRTAVRRALVDVYDRFPVLARRRRQRAGSLSGGEQQMVAIGRALMAAPDVLLLDEPTLGLAPIVVAEVTDILTGLTGGHTAIVLVEQNTETAFRVAQRGYVLDRGLIRRTGDVADLRTDPEVRAAYLGETSRSQEPLPLPSPRKVTP
ncbi:ABC transporter ATP-binding protein [Actinoplanes sp. NBRC 101535]|uniref:ABC transporter ATP-binding protein n=1 Tax=Actinoplanes sp. NBRC 101535 TaxID=3032196 RepID=UPI0024A083FA|nr:ABC transporter ATP-binding protein [Actinoplanes sp. NBRC 101535]GLY07966.1 ABC transporter ATP-binding protein [Actinoplanes sp. NBRC 101535]